MALNYSRLISQSCKFHQLPRIFNTSQLKLNSLVVKSAATQACPAETFDDKNKRLKRPLSPHLTIYKPQLTSMLSLTHRGTGIALAYYATAAALTELFVPGGVSCVLQSVEAMQLASPILFLGKLAVAFPATYHYFNGIRHLLWDLGLFFTIKEVYSTGWAVVGISSISALILAAMF